MKVLWSLGKGGQKVPVSGCIQVGWGALGANTVPPVCPGVLACNI